MNAKDTKSGAYFKAARTLRVLREDIITVFSGPCETHDPRVIAAHFLMSNTNNIACRDEQNIRTRQRRARVGGKKQPVKVSLASIDIVIN
jgi:hypothetical protein